MTAPRDRLPLRMTPEQRKTITQAARRLGLSLNRYVLTAALAYDADTARDARIEELFDRRLQEQTAAVADALNRLADLHDEHNAELRQKIKAALETVMAAVRQGDKK